jgi:hypothetical protein
MKNFIVLCLITMFSYHSRSQSCNVIDDFNPALTNTITEAENTAFNWYSDSNVFR